MHALAALCVKRPVFATMLIVALMVVGIFSFFTLGVDLFPKIDLPTMIVTVSNPGASAEEIQSDITKSIEDSVNTTSGIDTMQSTSIEGNSTVVISFSSTKAVTWLRRKCATRSIRWCRNCQRPLKRRWCRNSIRMRNPSCKWWFLRRGRCASHRDRRQADQAEAGKHLRVWARSPSWAALKREIRRTGWIRIKMRAYNLAVTDVAKALKAQKLELPAAA